MSGLADERIALGLRANWRQFALLVAVNAFVGGMIGLERTILPLLAEADFGIASKTAAVSFIAAFGLTKALTNLFAGWLADRFSRRSVLIAGWLFGLPVPLMLILRRRGHRNWRVFWTRQGIACGSASLGSCRGTWE